MVAPRFATPLHCRQSAPFNGLLLDWSQPVTLFLVEFKKGLCAETFDTEVCRPVRRRFCNSRSGQGQTNWGVSRPSPGRRAVPLQITSSYSPGDVESEYFHVPIPPKHRKFFSGHLALPLFVNNKFIELQPGGHFVCSRPDLASLVPSPQNPSHLRHFYHQVVEFSHAALPLGWTSSPRIWTSVMSVVSAALRRHGMSVVSAALRRHGTTS